jgi:hypothetical protein
MGGLASGTGHCGRIHGGITNGREFYVRRDRLANDHSTLRA